MTENDVKRSKKSLVTRDDLYRYYSKIFDWDRFFNFVTCSSRYAISRRAFWFLSCEEIPSKRLMFPTREAVYMYVMRELPLTIHLGCVWPIELQHGDQEAKQFVERELILDIDMNDYADARSSICKCGSSRKCCDACWKVFIQRTAVPFLKHMLCTVWGFQEVYFVFSGRRGLHVYVQDARAMRMTQEQRNHIVVQKTLECVQDDVIYEKIFAPIYKEYFPDSISTRETVLKTLMPRFDHGLLRDVSHVVKVPQSIHKDTAVVCAFINKPEEFLPSQGALFRVDRIFFQASNKHVEEK